MSYKNPAPFEALKNIAASIVASVDALQAHPEGAQAFAKWVEDMDFLERYGTRYKDLPVSEEIPETMVCAQDSFVVEEGVLYVESGYTRYVWKDGEWEEDEDY